MAICMYREQRSSTGRKAVARSAESDFGQACSAAVGTVEIFGRYAGYAAVRAAAFEAASVDVAILGGISLAGALTTMSRPAPTEGFLRPAQRAGA
ncbi:MAG: hypothetical protein QOG44_2886 [Acidimicrobiaceae bacterium]|nr:hypothetical protein [Acidimicrobiaceae bacterium]